MKNRCYMEFCSNEALHYLTDFGDGKSGPFDPARPVYEYRGVWGWCDQHKSEAWEERRLVGNVKRCTENARRGTGTGICDRPLDARGNCLNAGWHVA